MTKQQSVHVIFLAQPIKKKQWSWSKQASNTFETNSLVKDKRENTEKNKTKPQMPAIAEQYKLNPDGAKKSGKPGSEPPVPMKSTENVEIAEESFSAPTADKMSSEEIISYTEIR